MTHLSLTQADAVTLHQKYYRDYGLAIEGLVLHHAVDAMDFNAKVDGTSYYAAPS
jgi:pyrimidine and pyridine-specific 5'-nucleotidase